VTKDLREKSAVTVRLTYRATRLRGKYPSGSSICR